MYVRRNDLGDASCEKVPDDDTTVIASDGQQRAVFVEHTRDGQRNAIKRSVELLGIVLAKGFYYIGSRKLYIQVTYV